MNYLIDLQSEEPAYIQLYRHLVRDIVRKVYPFGSKLPSKRTIAADTGLSLITVEHALNLLYDEGYAEGRMRSGTFVIYRSEDFYVSEHSYDGEHFPAGEHSPGGDHSHDGEHFPAGEHSLVSEHSHDGDDPYSRDNVDDNDGKEKYGRKMTHVSYGGDTSTAAFDGTRTSGTLEGESIQGRDFLPETILARTVRKVLQDYGERILVQSPGRGCLELREEIRDYLARSRGFDVRTEQIVIGSGAEYLYGLIVQMLGRDRIFALEDPSYKKILQVYEAMGAKCELLAMGRSGIRGDELKKSRASVLHVTPYNSYPSGITADISKKLEYINWAAGRSGIIIEDNYDSELSVMRKPEEAIFTMTDEVKVIYINTFSKTIAPSVRVGYMILPECLVDDFEEKLGFYACTVPVLDQLVLAELIRCGDFERHINRVRRRRRAALKEM